METASHFAFSWKTEGTQRITCMGRLVAAGLKGMDKNQLFLSSKPWVTHSLNQLLTKLLCALQQCAMDLLGNPWKPPGFPVGKLQADRNKRNKLRGTQPAGQMTLALAWPQSPFAHQAVQD